MSANRLWTAILGHLARKPKGQLRFVDSTFIKVHQAGQGAIGGSKHQAIGLTKGGHNSKLTAAVDERGHVVTLLLFPGQCAETTAAKQLLPLLVKTMVFVGDNGFDTDELRQLSENNGGLACIPPRSNRAIHRWCDPSFIASDTWWKTSFSASSIGAASRPATRNSPLPSSLSQHSRPQSITSDANKLTRLGTKRSLIRIEAFSTKK
jgi:hypothetical protein